MRENKNIIAGKMARKNLNAMDDALIVIDPFLIALIKKSATLYNGKPAKPGKIIFLLNMSNPCTSEVLLIKLKIFLSIFII